MPNQPCILSDHHKFTSLHRYYAWSTVLRDHFQSRFDEVIKSENREDALLEWMGPVGLGIGAAFLSYWYVALCVVVEGWQELGYADPVIDELIASEHTARLKRHRNATCHYQKAIFVEKWNEFERATGSVEWLRRLDREFGRYFTDRTHANMRDFVDYEARMWAQQMIENPAKLEKAKKELQLAIHGPDEASEMFWRIVFERYTSLTGTPDDNDTDVDSPADGPRQNRGNDNSVPL